MPKRVRTHKFKVEGYAECLCEALAISLVQVTRGSDVRIQSAGGRSLARLRLENVSRSQRLGRIANHIEIFRREMHQKIVVNIS